MSAGDPTLAEALMQVYAAAGAALHLQVLAKQGSRSAQEKRLIVLLTCLAGLMVLRGAALVTQVGLLFNLSLAVGAATPLALFLFTEGLLRRHQPRVLKLFVLVGTGVSMLFALTGVARLDPRALAGFGVYILLVQMLVLVALIGRDRRDLSRTENGLADALTVSLVVLGPLFITDVLAGLGMHVVRVGSLGVLIFVYASLQLHEKRHAHEAIAAGMFYALGVAALFAASHAVLLRDLRPLTLARSVAIFYAIVLLLLIFGQVRTLLGRSREAELLRALAGADARTPEGLSHAVAGSPNLGRHRLLHESDLVDHDAARLVALLARSDQRVASLAQVRRARRDAFADLEAAERMADLLERHDMTHAVLIHASPAVILCVQARASGREELVRLELGLLARLASAGGAR